MRARKVELGMAVKSVELSHIASCSSPSGSSSGGRESAPGTPGSRVSQVSLNGTGGSAGGAAGTTSATSSPRVSGRYCAPTIASELRQSMTRRVAAASLKEDK